ncbi:uncharacterized protein LOC142984413 [Anticarsia gemmatalis]|uniref:uncharacterized protein LOC142984413 n=1 Tax=Anticarsia gemmatalis TaxID=129554 RepID=UPI003F76A9DB
MSVYRSDDPVTSTPKQPSKKDIPRLNPEEKAYMDKVANLIRVWMETLPRQFDDDDFKQTIINDLAGDIMDEVKREQLSPESNTEKEKHINYYVFRWLVRFDIFEDLNDAQPLVDIFLDKFKDIPAPKLTAPQHGTRQAMENLKHFEGDLGWEEEYVPKGIDVLEDQISVWMNEQPTEIYENNNRKNRDDRVKDLALKLQDHLRNKSPEDEIDREINEWMHRVVKPDEKEHIGILTQDLKEKIINVPQDATLEARHEKRNRQKAEYREDITEIAETELSSVYEDPEVTMREFILKYMEHNYDIDDTMARKAFGQLLITELRKLTPPTRKEVYDNLAKTETHDEFNPAKLSHELEYIKIISDWLKNIPINPLYNRTGNRARVDFVIDLAKNIQEVEEQRREQPDAMDYDMYISSVITQSVRTYRIPVVTEHKDNIPLMVDQLLAKIVAQRSSKTQNESTLGEIQEQNLSEFIEEYIRVTGREIAEDAVKLEVWSARLLKEVKKMLHEGADPSSLCKAQVYEKFASVPVPGDEPVKRYSTEIVYVKEISDWLKNLPLLPIENTPEAEENRVRMITDLAEKIAEREALKNNDPNDNTAEKNLVEYITTWIGKLPLDPRKEIVVPILIQQLLNRIEIMNRPVESHLETISDESDELRVDPADIRDAGTHIVEYIEVWCNNLPIEGNNDEVRNTKNNVARKLYQKIGELNADPRVYNDDLLYKNLLDDEIETLLENLPQTPELQNNRAEIKNDLLDTILTMKKAIQEKSIGDNYKHKLETTIEAALPDPVQGRQIIVPGFEIYKNHLANKFILDNFDHSDDVVKAKYEKRIKLEVDKYFESAQNKNALPMTKDEMYHELYSELYKVPMPDEEDVVDEVEEVKTRCEIDEWFEELPLKEADGVGEYLEWDQILSTLAKRIHEIEKYDPQNDEKVRKEILKWLWRLPLLPSKRDSNNVDKYVDKLQNALKTSAEDRKYVAIESPNTKDKSTPKRSGKKFNTSQTAGPSSEGQNWISPLKPYNQIIPINRKKPADLIMEAVEDWCNQLPINGDQNQKKLVKDNTSAKIVMKICELNMNADVFGDNVIYFQLLDEEIDKIMADLAEYCNFENSQTARKLQLLEMIQCVKPLIKEERRRQEYRTELNNTVANTLDDHDDTAEKMEEFNKLKDEIVDDFIQFKYSRYDDDMKRTYRKNIHDAVFKYITEIKDKGDDIDPLIRRNQLLCELSKIQAPNDVILREEVEDIRMKNEVEELFEDNSLNDNTERTSQMKKTLTKRLNDLEKHGHSPSNDNKMSVEIARCLKKINKEVKPEALNKFVESLKNNEAERRTPPLPKDPSYQRLREASVLIGERTLIFTPSLTLQQDNQYLQVPLTEQSRCYTPKWISLEPATPLPSQDTSNMQRMRRESASPHTIQGSNKPANWRESRQVSVVAPPIRVNSSYNIFETEPMEPGNQTGRVQNTSQNYGRNSVPNEYVQNKTNVPSPRIEQTQNYDDFKGGAFLSSSLAPQGQRQDVTQAPYSNTSDGRSLKDQYSRAVSPRQVRAETTAEPSTIQDITPDSLFQRPVFEPKPLYSPLPESNIPRPMTAPPSVAAINPEEEGFICMCNRKRKMRPYCLGRMDDCQDEFCPMWARMMFPGFWFMD